MKTNDSTPAPGGTGLSRWLAAVTALTFFACTGVASADVDAGTAPATMSAQIAVTVSLDPSAATGKKAFDVNALVTKLKTAASVFENSTILLLVDQRTPYEHVADLLRACQAAGLSNVKVETGGPVASLR